MSVDFFECVASSAESRDANICPHWSSSNSLAIWLSPIEVLVGLSGTVLSVVFSPDEPGWGSLGASPEGFVVGVDEVGIGNLHDNFCNCNSAVRSRL